MRNLKLREISEIVLSYSQENHVDLLTAYNTLSNALLDANAFDFDTVKIVLDRVGKEIEEPYKEKILDLVSSGEIREYDYLYLWNLINKLIDNYELQKAYDDRIKKFADTCNKYLINKHFNYNQSTLNLDISYLFIALVITL